MNSFFLIIYALGVAAGPALPPELQKASVVAQADHRGVIGFEILWETRVRGGPYRRSFRYRTAYAYDGERFLGARMLEKVDNGRAADPAALEAQTKKIEAERAQSSGGFAVPFDSRHFEEYRYVRGACDSFCLEGDTVIEFFARADDADHGDGQIVIARDGHVRRLEYTSQGAFRFLGARTSETHVTIDRGQVLAGFWATVIEQSHFVGHYAFVSGEALQTARYLRYRRFASDAQAIAAVREGQL